MDIELLIRLITFIVFLLTGIKLFQKQLAITGSLIIFGALFSVLPMVIPRVIEIPWSEDGIATWFEIIIVLANVGFLFVAIGLYKLVQQFKAAE